MRKATNIETVVAYGRLLEYSSNKRYGLLENSFNNNEIDKLALEFNEIIRNKTGLDITEIEDIDAILRYETIVDSELTEFTYKFFQVKDQSEEGKLLSSSYQIPADFLKNQRLGYNKSSFIKDFISLSSITVPSLNSYLKTAHVIFASNFKQNFPQHIFLNSIINYKGKRRLLFAHISKVDPDLVNRLNKDWEIEFIGLFAKDEFQSFIDSPVKLFLKIITDYGTNFKVNNMTKKFIYELSIPKTFSKEDLNIEIDNKNGGKFAFWQIKETVLGIYLYCCYSIRDEKLIQDSLEGKV